MTSTTWAILIVGVIVIALAILFAFKARTKKLKSKFGPEYDRVVRESGGTIAAEKELEHRAKRVENFKIHSLPTAESDAFAKEWRSTQERFVDDPRAALAEADRLVHRVMKARGYPIGGEFEQRAADISVDYPRVVEHYRAGHDIAESDGRKAVSTENLRLAMKHYRALFEDLLGRRVDEVTGARR
jgi:hypothetical protein